MKVSDFMTTRLESVNADQSVYDAVEKMVDRRIRSLLVRFPGDDMTDGVLTALFFGSLSPALLALKHAMG